MVTVPTIRTGPDPIPPLMNASIDVAEHASPSHQGPVVPHGHQASLEDGLAFVNTLEYDRSRVIEHLPTPAAAMSWFFDHELLHKDMRDELTTRLGQDEVAGERALRRIARV